MICGRSVAFNFAERWRSILIDFKLKIRFLIFNLFVSAQYFVDLARSFSKKVWNDGLCMLSMRFVLANLNLRLKVLNDYRIGISPRRIDVIFIHIHN